MGQQPRACSPWPGAGWTGTLPWPASRSPKIGFF
jgi:hypothetical protein